MPLKSGAIQERESEARIATDSGEVISARQQDHNGWPEIRGNPLSKTGVYPYSGRSIRKDLDPNKIYMVYRPAEELAHPDAIKSFQNLPWIEGHEMLGGQHSSTDEKGIKGIIGSEVYFDPEQDKPGHGTLRGNLKLFSDNLRAAIDSGEKKELSVGYRCRYEDSSGIFDGQHYDFIQRELRGNHLASVPSGRMGRDVAVLDHLTITFDAREIIMADENKKEDEGAGEGGKKAMTLEEVTAALAEWGPKISKMQSMVEKHFGSNDADTDAAATDGDDKDKPGDTAKDADDKDGKEGKGMDAKEVKVAMDSAISAATAPLKAELAGLKKDGIKAMLKEVSARDTLADKLSHHVGVFDHSEMTLEEVAQYGFDKLELPKDLASDKIGAVKGYLHGRAAPTQTVSFAQDSADGKKGEVDTYLKGDAKK